MRILRVVRSRHLQCGCLTGVYETYRGPSVEIVDSRSLACKDERHRPGAVVPTQSAPLERGEPDPPTRA